MSRKMGLAWAFDCMVLLGLILMAILPSVSCATDISERRELLERISNIEYLKDIVEGRSIPYINNEDLNYNKIDDRLEKEILDGNKKIEVIILFNFERDWATYRYKISNNVLEYLKHNNIEILDVLYYINMVHAKVPVNYIKSLASHSWIRFIGPVPKFKLYLDSSVPAIKADKTTLANNNLAGIDGSGVNIAILDSGVYADHPALQGKVVGWRDFTGDKNGNEGDTPYDDNGHGTHCASIAAGVDDTYSGVAPGANIIGVKVMRGDGIGGESVLHGIEWIVQNKDNYNIRVASLSLGTVGGGDSNVDSAARSAVTAGIVVCVAAGNEGDTVMGSPARDPYVITVGSCTDNGAASDFSTTGPGYDYITEQEVQKPDVTAPGESIIAARAYCPDHPLWNPEGDGYPDMYDPYSGMEGGQFIDQYWIMAQGTSMACPHVAGLAALMLQANPSLTPEDIKNTLISNTFPGTGGGDGDYKRGYGKVNALDAILAIGNPPILDSYTANGQQSIEVDEDEVVSFTASAHDSNPDGYIVRYDWDLDGDGQVDATGQTVSYSYPKSGIYTVTVWAIDNQGLSDEGHLSVSVRNVPPTADAGSDISAYMDEIVTLDASGSTDTPSDLSSLNYYWDLDGDGSYTDAEGVRINKTWTVPGTYTIGLKVVDDDYAEDTDTIQVTIENVPPIAVVRLGEGIHPGSIYEDDEVKFDASDSSDTPSDINKLQYLWDFDSGDGINWDDPDATGKTPKHTYTESGRYTVTLKVIDPHGGEDTATIDVVVNNVIPIARIKGISPTDPTEGQIVMADATTTWDTASDLNLLNYTWDVDIDYDSDGNGIPDDDVDAFGHVIYFAPVRDGEITMKLTVRDDDGDADTVYHTFNATNVPPKINDPEVYDEFGNPITEIYEGQTIIIKANITDVITDLEIMDIVWEFRDGERWGWEVEYTPENDGYIPFVIMATDNQDTVSMEFPTLIKVLNTPPVVTGGTEDRTANVGEKITFELNVEDSEEDLGNMEYTWLFGDGSSTTTNEPKVQHTYSNGGEYVVKVTINDGTDSVMVRINVSVNTPPTIFVSAPGEVELGEKIKLSAEDTKDPDGDEIVLYEWDLDGDGVFEKNGAVVEIKADKVGTIKYTVRIKDSRGGIATKSGTITVKEKSTVFGGSEGTFGGTYTIAIIITVIIVVIIVAVLLIIKSKEKRLKEDFFKPGGSGGGSGTSKPGAANNVHGDQQYQGYDTYNRLQTSSQYPYTGTNYGPPQTTGSERPMETDTNQYRYTNYEEIYGGGGEL